MPSDALRDPVSGLRTKDWIIDLQSVAGRAGEQGAGALAALVVQYHPDTHLAPADLSAAQAAALLRILALRLTPLLRGGTMVGRGDREEFLVLAPDVAGPDRAGPIADRISHALTQPLLLGTRRLVPQVWIGIALGAPGGGLELLLRRASLAARVARSLGPNMWHCLDFGDAPVPASRSAITAPRPRGHGDRRSE